MTLQKGDFVVLEYVAKVKETGEVFDTTNEETAKKEHLHKEGDVYESKLVIVGEGWVIKALDESLTTLEIGKPQVVEITPDKAFGPRDAEKVKRVPLKQLLAKDITPSLGMRLEYGGKMATVRAMGAGRVLLDFNPPLAGKTLIYEITASKRLETPEQKIGGLIHRRIAAVEAAKFEFSIGEKNIKIEMPEEAFYLDGIQLAKRGIAADIQKFFHEITTVKFVETFRSEEKKPEETKPEETKRSEASQSKETEKSATTTVAEAKAEA